MTVFPSFSQEEFAHSSAPPGKKKKKKPEMGFPEIEWSLLIDDVDPSFYHPPLHTGRSGGGEVSSPSDCIGNISQPAQGL